MKFRNPWISPGKHRRHHKATKHRIANPDRLAREAKELERDICKRQSQASFHVNIRNVIALARQLLVEGKPRESVELMLCFNGLSYQQAMRVVAGLAELTDDAEYVDTEDILNQLRDWYLQP